MQLRALIIDDEPLAHKVIIEYAKDLPALLIAGQCYSATEAMPLLSRESIDLLFLDIHMPKISGLELLKTLHHQPSVIITSAHEGYALESFELNVCDYLLKPFSYTRFLKAINKALEWQGLKKGSPPASSSPTHQVAAADPTLFIKVDKRLIQVMPDDIYYLESYGNYVKVWLEKNFHLTLRTLSSFEDQLDTSRFIRIHKSFMVNKSFIDYIEGNLIIMRNGQRLSVGKNFRSKLKDLIR